jgi:hypothetical protein
VIESRPSADLAILLDAFDKRGGVLAFAFYDPTPRGCSAESHRDAAWQFLDARATASREFRNTIDTDNPLARLLTYKWNDTKLRGRQIPFHEFWGTDDVEPKPTSGIPDIDGYKPAFFHPPHGLHGGVSGNLHLFESINSHVLGDVDRTTLTIWSWSTDCSSYFDDGHEWWGAFLWTVARPDMETIVVIAASATD